MTSAPTTAAKTPPGWAGMIGELYAAPNLQAFHEQMLSLQCKIVAADHGALWVRGSGEGLQLAASWPGPLTVDLAKGPLGSLFHRAARGGFDRGASHVLKVDDAAVVQPGHTASHLFVTVLRAGGEVAAVATVLAETRDIAVIQATTPLRELAAGLYEGFFSRHESHRLREETERVRRAMSLLATSQEGDGFKGTCFNLVNELARSLACTRVSVGWVKGRHVKVIAMSDTEHLKKHSEPIALLEMAMAECLDQQQPVLCPPGNTAEPLLADAVVHSHRRLLEAGHGSHALSIPLRDKDELIGVLTLERAEQSFDPADIRYLQLVSDLLAVHLRDRRNSDRLLVGHSWESVKWAASYLVGPRHVGWKLLAVAVAALLAVAVFGWWDYKVTSEFVLEAHSKRIIASPYEAELATVLVEPGDRVQAGQVLATLDVVDRRLELAQALADLRKAELEKRQAAGEGRGKEAERQQLAARAEQLQARVELLQHQIEQATLRAPIDGLVLSGYWLDKLGSVVDQEDALFEIADVHDLIAVLRVDERDVDQLPAALWQARADAQEVTGVLTTRSQPGIKFGFRVDRVVPSAQPVEGTNQVEVRAVFRDWRADEAYAAPATVMHGGRRYLALSSSGPRSARGSVEPGADEAVWREVDWLRPGMEGVARIDVGQRRIAWIATHRLTDLARLWLWW